MIEKQQPETILHAAEGCREKCRGYQRVTTVSARKRRFLGTADAVGRSEGRNAVRAFSRWEGFPRVAPLSFPASPPNAVWELASSEEATRAPNFSRQLRRNPNFAMRRRGNGATPYGSPLKWSYLRSRLGRGAPAQLGIQANRFNGGGRTAECRPSAFAAAFQ